jgi:hypothetical protein
LTAKDPSNPKIINWEYLKPSLHIKSIIICAMIILAIGLLYAAYANIKKGWEFEYTARRYSIQVDCPSDNSISQDAAMID